MKKEIEYIDLDTGEVKTVEETIPNALPQRIADKANAKYKATIRQKGNKQEAQMNDPFEGVKDSKKVVIEYLIDNWFKTDLSIDEIRGRTSDEIVGEYEEDLYGVSKKKGGD